MKGMTRAYGRKYAVSWCEPSRLRVVAEKFRKILGLTVSRGLFSCKLPEDRALSLKQSNSHLPFHYLQDGRGFLKQSNSNLPFHNQGSPPLQTLNLRQSKNSQNADKHFQFIYYTLRVVPYFKVLTSLYRENPFGLFHRLASVVHILQNQAKRRSV